MPVYANSLQLYYAEYKFLFYKTKGLEVIFFMLCIYMYKPVCSSAFIFLIKKLAYGTCDAPDLALNINGKKCLQSCDIFTI